jgi:CheY-like chemotaxis protein
VSTPLPADEHHHLETLTILGTSPEQTFDDFARMAAIACDTPIAVVGFVDEQSVWFKATIGLDVEHISRDHAFCTYTILQSEVLIVRDPLADDRFAADRLVTEAGIRFYAGVPLMTRSDYCIGALAVMDRVPHLMTEEQIDSLQILARRIVHELELRQESRDAQSPRNRPHLVVSRQPPVNILLVEDNDNLRDLLRRTLEGVGFFLFSARDGVEALGLCEQHGGALDLVVSDIAMPRLDGLDLSERIRATYPKTKFLFITGSGDRFPDLRERMKHGANILEKPFLPSELLRKVEDALAPPQEGRG